VRVPWADRIMALPFLTLLAPSKRFYDGKSRSPKTLLDWARQAPRCKSTDGCRIDTLSWSPTAPSRPSNSLQPSATMSASSPACASMPTCFISRHLNAKTAAAGRSKASPTKSFPPSSRIAKSFGSATGSACGYGRTNRIVEITSGTALWYRGGVPPVPIRWLLVREPSGELEPQAFLATDLNAHPHDILAWFVSRWQVRAHLGVETQRQWSDNAILPRPRLSSPCSPSSRCGRMISPSRKSSSREPPRGIQNRFSRSVMPSRQFDAYVSIDIGVAIYPARLCRVAGSCLAIPRVYTIACRDSL
jgi:hypothetical protein